MRKKKPLSLSFSFEDDLELGEWLRQEIKTMFGFDHDPADIQRVRHVERQLQIYRAPRTRLTPEIVQLRGPNAMTAPGRYVYVTKDLIRLAKTDEGLAFVLAHEMGHHDLGHFDAFKDRRSAILSIPAGAHIAILLFVAERLLIGPEAESAADAYALRLCQRAGYDGRSCVRAMDILEKHAIDRRDFEAVFGRYDPLENDVQAVRQWASRLKEWGRRRVTGYPPIRERKENLLKLLA